MVANLSLFNAPDNMAVVQSDLNVLVNAYNAGGITTAQTNQSLGIYAVGNTVGQTNSLTFDARSLSIQGTGNISVGESNGSLVISGQNPTVFQAGANATQLVNGQLLLQGGNNVTLSQSISSNSATVTINAANAPQLVNSNGISFGTSNGNQVTASYTVPTQSTQSYNLIGASGNTTGTTNIFTSGTIVFAGGNNITLSQNSNTISINAAAVGAGSFTGGVSNLGNTLGTTGAVNNQLIFVGGNNVTLSQSTNGQSATVTISAGNGGGGGIAAAAGTQTQTSGTLVFANSNGLTFGMSGSSQVTASYTVPTQSAQTQSLIQAIYDGANSITTGTIRFTNANGVSFGINGQTLSGSVAAQSNQNISLFALGNTTQNSSTVLNASNLSFNGLGAATVGYSNGSIQLSVPVQTVQTQSNIQAIYDGVNSISTGTIRFTNANGVSFSVNGQTISGSVAAQTNQSIGLYALGNTTQNSSTTLDARTLSFNGLGGITVGYSNNSIQISGAAGGAGQTVSRKIYPDNAFTAISVPVQGSMSIQYFPCEVNLSATRADLFASITGSAIVGSSVVVQISQWMGVYTRNASTLNSVSTASTVGVLTSSNGVGIQGFCLMSCPLNINMTPGDYYVMANISSAYATFSNGDNSTNSSTVASLSMTMYGGGQIGSFNAFGTNFINLANATQGLYSGMGLYSATSNAVPASISLSGITQTGTAIQRANLAMQFRAI